MKHSLRSGRASGRGRPGTPLISSRHQDRRHPRQRPADCSELQPASSRLRASLANDIAMYDNGFMQARKPYPTDLTDEQYDLIAHLLPPEKAKGTRGREQIYSNRELIDGILYHLRVGGAWRTLPHDLPTGIACTLTPGAGAKMERSTGCRSSYARECACRQVGLRCLRWLSSTVRRSRPPIKGGARAAKHWVRREQEDQRTHTPPRGRHAGPPLVGRSDRRFGAGPRRSVARSGPARTIQ